ncbi:MAG TPA: hypothetical protein VJV77_01260 [Casimicrobiaceae bacterium]|nr:hypothetical protein [Casimicrobiaceae bacterium]
MAADRVPEHEHAPDPGRARDLARIVTLLGTVLFLPPVVLLFATDARIGGMPLIVVYLFGVWLALIGCARLLAHRLDPRPPDVSLAPAPTDASPIASHGASHDSEPDSRPR